MCYTLWGESRAIGLAEFETLFPWFRIVTSLLFRSGASRFRKGALIFFDAVLGFTAGLSWNIPVRSAVASLLSKVRL